MSAKYDSSANKCRDASCDRLVKPPAETCGDCARHDHRIDAYWSSARGWVVMRFGDQQAVVQAKGLPKWVFDRIKARPSRDCVPGEDWQA